jgi:choline kinase|tara:strand:+ start:6459 stop:7214 length:756 start_codon:yes stop_codon:yes gene_type:complete
MKAIILAAGKGSRLGSVTKNIPKGMLEVFGKTLIERQIEIYRNCGIEDITIVTGYKNEIINYSNVDYILNQNYATTNINESLFCASKKLTDEVIISYTDIIFEQKIIRQMLEFSGDIGIAVNVNWRKNYEGRNFHPLSEAENVLIENESVYEIRKNISKNTFDQQIAEFLGIMKLSQKGGKILLEKYNQLKDNHQGSFHTANSLDQAYITDMLQEIINSGNDVRPIKTNGNWAEIDTTQDLEIVKKSSMFS